MLVFAEEGSDAAQVARGMADAGASLIIGGAEMVNDVASNRVADFTKVISTPGLLPQISRTLARSLGPKGLMPSAKRGTVAASAEDMQRAIREASGAMDWRGDRNGVVRGGECAFAFEYQALMLGLQLILPYSPQTAVGRIHFSESELRANVQALLEAVRDRASGGPAQGGGVSPSSGTAAAGGAASGDSGAAKSTARKGAFGADGPA